MHGGPVKDRNFRLRFRKTSKCEHPPIRHFASSRHPCPLNHAPYPNRTFMGQSLRSRLHDADCQWSVGSTHDSRKSTLDVWVVKPYLLERSLLYCTSTVDPDSRSSENSTMVSIFYIFKCFNFNFFILSTVQIFHLFLVFAVKHQLCTGSLSRIVYQLSVR